MTDSAWAVVAAASAMAMAALKTKAVRRFTVVSPLFHRTNTDVGSVARGALWGSRRLPSRTGVGSKLRRAYRTVNVSPNTAGEGPGCRSRTLVLLKAPAR